MWFFAFVLRKSLVLYDVPVRGTGTGYRIDSTARVTLLPSYCTVYSQQCTGTFVFIQNFFHHPSKRQPLLFSFIKKKRGQRQNHEGNVFVTVEISNLQAQN